LFYVLLKAFFIADFTSTLLLKIDLSPNANLGECFWMELILGEYLLK